MMKTFFSLTAGGTPPAVALLLCVAAFGVVLFQGWRASRAETARAGEMPFHE